MENQSSSIPCSWSSISKLKSTGNANITKHVNRNVGTKLKNQQPKQCSNCGTLTSSMWRRTANKQVACNACGLYYKLYGVNRPVEMRKDIVYPRNRYSKLTGSSSKTGNKNSGITIGNVGGTSMLKSSPFLQTAANDKIAIGSATKS
ncbi:GATA-binding factor 2-like protein [Euroglyphus maynei]|uniref:GATA-binding factor 2-like protein n=1 Tax=Euroglyphus maynei TaxID=6958 RepID=A0A1Y3AP70_EURMA|nr:GATA-binding factor 2-like protein [Euroglyphus maynei]